MPVIFIHHGPHANGDVISVGTQTVSAGDIDARLAEMSKTWRPDRERLVLQIDPSAHYGIAKNTIHSAHNAGYFRYYFAGDGGIEETLPRPAPTSPSEMIDYKHFIDLQVEPDGRVLVDGQSVAPARLDDGIATAVRNHRGGAARGYITTLRIFALPDVQWINVRRVLDAARKAGDTQVFGFD
jgi:biopolymer transport protein ExbD